MEVNKSRTFLSLRIKVFDLPLMARNKHIGRMIGNSMVKIVKVDMLYVYLSLAGCLQTTDEEE